MLIGVPYIKYSKKEKINLYKYPKKIIFENFKEAGFVVAQTRDYCYVNNDDSFLEFG